ncbi:MAG: spermidine/putrescine transport system substrate-binding protein [Paracoccaceae bacterium]|jgi:spermidine/putrescine transport system substrate-binding protein
MGQINRRNLLRAAAGSLAAPALLQGGRATAAATQSITLVTACAAPDAATLDAFIAATSVTVAVIRARDADAVTRAMADGSADLAVLPHDAALRLGAAALAPLDAQDLPMNALAPGMATLADDWRVPGDAPDRLRWLPAGWGADGIAWRTDRWTPWGGAPSYADLWDGSRAAFGPARSMLLGAGLHLEHTGALAPGALWAAHGDAALAADVWARIEAWCAPRAAHIRATGRGGAQALATGTVDSALIDARAATDAARRGAPLSFAAPLEGAMARMMGFVRPTAAANGSLEASTTFAAFVMARDGGMADWSGAEAMMDAEALIAMHPMPPESPAHAARRKAASVRIFG